MYEKNSIAHNLKAEKEQIMDELNTHIRNLDDEIDSFMKPEEKQASQAIQDVTGIVNTSAQTIVSVTGTDMSRLPIDAHISSWQDYVPVTMRVVKREGQARQEKEMPCCGQL